MSKHWRDTDFKPSDLPGLKLWWDATDHGSIIYKNDGSIRLINKATRWGRFRSWVRRHTRRDYSKKVKRYVRGPEPYNSIAMGEASDVMGTPPVNWQMITAWGLAFIFSIATWIALYLVTRALMRRAS